MEHYIGALKNYATFTGRATRQEYWMFVLFNFIFMIIAGTVDGVLGSYGLVSGIYGLGVLLPSLAIAIRRLHDIDKSGWFMLVSLIPIIGGLWLLIMFCTKGTDGINSYNENFNNENFYNRNSFN
jgi:uncharacterized membrane protein YhaH (DUF805 family)